MSLVKELLSILAVLCLAVNNCSCHNSTETTSDNFSTTQIPPSLVSKKDSNEVQRLINGVLSSLFSSTNSPELQKQLMEIISSFTAPTTSSELQKQMMSIVSTLMNSGNSSELPNPIFKVLTSFMNQTKFPELQKQLTGVVSAMLNSANMSQLPKQLLSLMSPQNKDAFKQIQDQIMGLLSSGLSSFTNNNNSSSPLVQTLQSLAQNEGSIISTLNSNPALFNAVLRALGPSNGNTSQSLISRLSPVALAYLKGMVPSLSTGLINLNVSQNCSNHFTHIVNGILNMQPWALKFLDSMGKPKAGLLDGAFLWPGSFHECLNIKAPEDADSFKGNYCLLKIQVPPSLLQSLAGSTTGQGNNGLAAAVFMSVLSLSYGLCIPSSCSSDDVSNIVNKGLFEQLFHNEQLQANPQCKKEPDLENDQRAIIVVAVCGSIGLIILIGTAYDVITEWRWNHGNRKKKDRNEDINLATVISNEKSINYTPDDSTLANGNHQNGDIQQNGHTYIPEDLKPKENNVYVVGVKDSDMTKNGTAKSTANGLKQEHAIDYVKSKRPKPGILGGLLLAFSVYTNSKKILSTDQKSGSLSSVNGVRFLSMSWVVLGHTYFFHLSSENNAIGYATDFIKRWTAQGILNALVSVDSFFTLSGLLVAYLTLREMGKKQSAKINWFMFYFHRFWRLTPPYMLILMVYVPLFHYWGTGPQWPTEQIEPKPCNEYWWRNLIYINNFNLTNSCMGWTWYLANDMQFYVISPLILIPLFYSKIIGLIILGMFFLATFIATGVISYKNGFAPMDSNPDFMTKLYIKPWCRIGPYLVGLFVGYILYKTKCKVKLHKSTVILGWCAAIVIALATLYGVYGNSNGHPLSAEASAVYNALHRTAWGMAVGWVLFACCTGYGGIINTFLSWKAFIPLARLTYMTYLVHPIIMMYYNSTTPEAIYVTDVTVSYLFVGNMFFSYGFAFLVSLAFEAPMMGLERVIFRRK